MMWLALLLSVSTTRGRSSHSSYQMIASSGAASERVGAKLLPASNTVLRHREIG